MALLPPELLGDPGRLLSEWLVPVLAGDPSLGDVQCVVEIVLHRQEAPERTERVFQIEMNRGVVRSSEGAALRPDFRARAELDDFRALCTGELNARAALIDGRLRISGDLGLAMRIAPVLFADR